MKKIGSKKSMSLCIKTFICNKYIVYSTYCIILYISEVLALKNSYVIKEWCVNIKML